MQSGIRFCYLVFLRLISDMRRLGDLDSSFCDIEATHEIVVAGSVGLASSLIGCYSLRFHCHQFGLVVSFG